MLDWGLTVYITEYTLTFFKNKRKRQIEKENFISLSSSREILDQQDGTIEDDGLTGLLRLATSVLKHKPPFKFSREGQEFLRDVHNLLFLLPSLADRSQPKCKSHSARAAAYDLLVETVKGSVENYRLLHNWVMSQHMQGEDACLRGAFRTGTHGLNFFTLLS